MNGRTASPVCESPADISQGSHHFQGDLSKDVLCDTFHFHSIYNETTSMGIDICEFIPHTKESHGRRGRKLSAPDVSDVSFPLVL